MRVLLLFISLYARVGACLLCLTTINQVVLPTETHPRLNQNTNSMHRLLLPITASRYQTSPPSYQQNHQQGVPVAAAVLPPPAATAVNQALPMLSPPKERSIDDLVNEFLANSAPPPPEPTDQDSAMADPQGWVAALGRLAGRRAWSTLVDVAGTMLVVHRGGGAPGLTAEQVRKPFAQKMLQLFASVIPFMYANVFGLLWRCCISVTEQRPW